MARDPRNRNARHGSRDTGPTTIEWANDKQREAFEYGPYPLCMSGGFGAAKTWALCLKVLWLSTTFPHNRILIARKVGKELRLTTQSTFFKICPPRMYDERDGGRRSDSENYLRLAEAYGGSEILWMHLEDEEIMGVLRGLEINGFLFDQCEEISEEVFDTAMSRLGRWDKAEVTDTTLAMFGQTAETWPWKAPNGRLIVPTYPMIACNPDTELHWIYRRFHPDSADWQEKYRGLGYRMISVSSFENKFLPQQNRDLLEQADESFKRRFVYGEWGIPEGQIHHIQPESMLEGDPATAAYLFNRCRLSRSLDHGDTSPTAAGWWGTDEDGNVFLIAEYYEGGRVISEHRRAIKQLTDWFERISGGERFRFVYQLADPSIFSPTQSKNQRISVADDYEDVNPAHGFSPDDAICWERGDNDELGTRNIINEYLRLQGTGRKWSRPDEPHLERDEDRQRFEKTREEPRVHPITKKLGYWPRLFFLKKNEAWQHGADRALIETRSQRREKIGTNLGRPIFSDDRDESITDHAYDFVRYFMASRAAAPAKPVARYSKNSFFGKRDELLRLKRLGKVRA